MAKDSSSDVLACGNNSKGGAFNKLHCVATLFCSWMSVCVSINNPCTLYVYKYTTDLPLSLPFILTDTCTDLILTVTICVAASDVLGTMDWESIVSIPSLTVSVLAVAQRSSNTICKYFKILYGIISFGFCKYFIAIASYNNYYIHHTHIHAYRSLFPSFG